MLLEPDDLLNLPNGESFELVDGRLQEKTIGARSEEIAGHVFAALHQFIRAHGLGHLFGSQTAYRCFSHRPRLVRKPDASFVAKGRFLNDQSPDGDISIQPDLVVESISPNDSFEEIEERVNDFLKAGVRLIWIVSPVNKTVLIRRPDKSAAMLDVTDTLSGEDVVPGFSCPVADLFS